MPRPKKIAAFLFGNQQTIQHAFIIGLFTSISITVIVILYYASLPNAKLPLNAPFQDISSQPEELSRGELLQFLISQMGIPFILFGSCLGVLFVLVGGRSINWLLTRPLAMFLCTLFPHVEYSMNWAIANAFVWFTLVFLIIHPDLFKPEFASWAPAIFVLILTLILSFLCGRIGARLLTYPSKNQKELVAAGATATSSFIFGAQAFVRLISFNQTNFHELPGATLAFCLIIALFSLLFVLPYFLISLILSAISNVSSTEDNLLLNYTLTSAICWLLIGLFFARGVVTDSLRANLGMLIIFGLGGASGGWVIGQIKENKPSGETY